MASGLIIAHNTVKGWKATVINTSHYIYIYNWVPITTRKLSYLSRKTRPIH